jgi:hypothetical protein
MSTPDEPDAPKHTGGRFRKGVSGNPGGKKRVAAPQPPQPAPKPASAQASQPKVEQPKNTGRNQDGTFAKGFAANPAGKPKGARHKTTLAMEALLDGEGETLTRKAIELAKGGDIQALPLCMERLLPPRRDRSVNIDMPTIEKSADLVSAAASIAENVGCGELTPGEGADLAKLVESTARAVEVHELAERLSRLEEQVANKGSAP